MLGAKKEEINKTVDFKDGFDVIVVGAGHAGCEAAAAAAAMGARTALYTFEAGLIAQMSCNPAIGGIAKGHLVREIDALGGIMGEAADKTGIQFRLLNRSRGPAVQAPRCQSDKARYHNKIQETLESKKNLHIIKSEVTNLIVKEGIVTGVELSDGSSSKARAVILTTGTFLNGLIHVGDRRQPAGRIGEAPSISLAKCLRELGLTIGRLKTGTPSRLDRRTIDFKQFEEQKGDEEPVYFSFHTKSVSLPQVSCYLGYTNERLHDIIRRNLKLSALYGGHITGIGPRYCPSVEDKVVKFADKARHQIFLEPEGLDVDEIYLNGLSSSMPAEIQKEMIESIPGLEHSRIIRPGYAIEYDFVQPIELNPSLETKKVKGLFHAGQINGTTGYEEAAAQGLVAGINAALQVQEKDPIIFPREDSYIGILIDDLVTKGVDEPYRMFTSRSELRLLLRIDNADKRLKSLGYKLGLIAETDFNSFKQKYEKVERTRKYLKENRWKASEIQCPKLAQKLDIHAIKGFTLEEILRRPEIQIEDLEPLLREHNIWPESIEERQAADIEIRYEGYIQQQIKDAEKLRRMSTRKIPEDFKYENIDGLNREVKEKLNKVRPLDLAMAGRIPGMTPAAVSILQIQLEMRQARLKKNKTAKIENAES